VITEVESLIQKLEKLSQVFVAVEVQEGIYKKILGQLQESYTKDRRCFSDANITRIKELKGKIEAPLAPAIKKRTQLISFFPQESLCSAESYFKPKVYTPCKGKIVFHEVDYCVGVICDRNSVEGTYEIRNLNNSHYTWCKSSKLLVLGLCDQQIWHEDIWSDLASTRVTHCWNCKTYLSPGDKMCGRCNWYVCPSCHSCRCSFLSV
jgi:hypothetical protein